MSFVLILLRFTGGDFVAGKCGVLSTNRLDFGGGL